MNLVDPSGEKFSISAFAAGALNSFTMGASNAIAGKLFGFDPSCADWGDGYGLGVFIGDFNPRGIIKRSIRSAVERRSWSTVRRDYWKRNGPNGKAPTREVLVRDSKTGQVYVKTETKELHHKLPRRTGGSHDDSNLDEVWPAEHAGRDEHRHTGYEVIRVL